MSIVTLKKSFDTKRKAGSNVSTKNTIGRIARGLDIGRRTVESILAEESGLFMAETNVDQP